jgi:hypothetical protein
MMEPAEALAQYRARPSRPGGALLGWRVVGAAGEEQELLYPSLAAALQTAAALALDPCCQAVWVCDGPRRYEGAAIAARLAELAVDGRARR